jgi:hypothetical protein
MTEKKTFTGDVDIQAYGHHWEIDDNEANRHTFKHSEWDMEVTFTKKPREVKAGQWMTVGEMQHAESVYVLAVHGTMAWISDDPDNLAGGELTAWTVNVDTLS